MKKVSKERRRLKIIWNAMKSRCYNPNNYEYNIYGGRGIKIQDDWLNNFEIFYNWAINNNYGDTLSIDRINNNEGYFDWNCRFATAKEQANNKSNNIIVEINGENKTLSQWAEEYGINYKLVHGRVSNGWDAVKALTTPMTIGKPITIGNETHNLKDWARKYSANYKMVHRRVSEGWDVLKALTTPVCREWDAHHPKKFYVIDGVSKSITEWSKTYNIDHSVVRARLMKNWEIEKALSTPICELAPIKNKIYEINGKSKSIGEWAQIYNLEYRVVRDRIRKGWEIERALTQPLQIQNKKKKGD